MQFTTGVEPSSTTTTTSNGNAVLQSKTNVYLISIAIAAVCGIAMVYCFCTCIRNPKKKNQSWWLNRDGDSRPSRDKTSHQKKDKTGKKKKKKHDRKHGKRDRDAANTNLLGMNSGANADDISSDGAGASNAPQIHQTKKLYRDVTDQALLASFRSVLADGLTITLHSSEGRPKQVKLWLIDHQLRWAPKNAIIKKRHKMYLEEVLFVEKGKQTATFARNSARNAPEQCCFSLVTQNETLDFEASSKMEREAMCQGFTLCLEDIKRDSAARGDIADTV